MDRPRILVDFNNYLHTEPMFLSRTTEVADSDGNMTTLTEGLPVYVYEPDQDWYGRDDYLLADGTATRGHLSTGEEVWCLHLDERGVRHQSDEPGFRLPDLAPAQMREHMYSAIEQTVSHVEEPDRWGIKHGVGTWLSELRRIDAEELTSDADGAVGPAR